MTKPKISFTEVHKNVKDTLTKWLSREERLSRADPSQVFESFLPDAENPPTDMDVLKGWLCYRLAELRSAHSNLCNEMRLRHGPCSWEVGYVADDDKV